MLIIFDPEIPKLEGIKLFKVEVEEGEYHFMKSMVISH